MLHNERGIHGPLHGPFPQERYRRRGKSCEICQRIVDVDARDATEATLLAQQQFCEFREIGDWSLHADRIDMQPADFPS
ncbi:hypothetical protein ABIF65_005830 [Bradyrhizobium japonicum]|jgi:hypothetical protein|uniref:hypothetical protein n=1 Tax=Bradyrhizobium TaxID=374 RepID=UPI00040E98C2|nr:MULTISPECIES: hypothetical protein [Bradyrhizobium]MBR0882970.1 hypothetical protein [Bradyrhizobium liaoningense]MBR0947670.1 hypothetical protein [Bradyrhizobium liaoningense]MBR1003991.1 hypothetical protein [Bradyrhizobium liaoningense]MBR1032640.1 hypothetical protein [Bradyrhizobium liaoningense]MBR1069345.1 hypothetical protein [Bradyrhizobium liaoningense]